MKMIALMVLALGLSTAASTAAFAQNDSCGTPTNTPAWSEALAAHGPFQSADERIKFMVDFVYKNCSGGEVVELPQTLIALCNFNKSILRMDAADIVCVLVSQN